MDYSKLLEDGRIKNGRFSRKQVEDCLAIANRDVTIARTVLESSPEWAFNIAYNAMQQAGRAFMLSKGFRTDGEAHHATVIQFLEIALGHGYDETLAVMDRMRRKRNRSTYDMVGIISDKEAKEAVSIADEFVGRVSVLLKSP